MALHQVIVYGNYTSDPEEEDFIINDYILDYPELLTKSRVTSMIERTMEPHLVVTDIQILRE